jgi:23S rRNA pseudouridine1911/1915/1917 synthase
MSHTIHIIYEDENIIGINKPSGLLSIPDRFDATKPNALHLVRKGYPEALTVHRLDRETSGVLLFARNPATHKYLNTLFEKGTIEKYYLTLVEGTPLHPEGIIEAAILPNPAKPGTMKVAPQGKYAKSTWRVLESFKHFSLIEVRIFTGRMHQVRVHMQYIGHPPVADPHYGLRAALYITDIKKGARTGKEEPPRPLIQRTALHAYRLVLHTPDKVSAVEIIAELPKDFSATLNQLRKHNR